MKSVDPLRPTTAPTAATALVVGPSGSGASLAGSAGFEEALEETLQATPGEAPHPKIEEEGGEDAHLPAWWAPPSIPTTAPSPPHLGAAKTAIADSTSHPEPGDPRRSFVEGDDGLDRPTDRGPTAREPGMRARGLRLDSARPGGAGVESFRIQSRSTLSGSRGFPAHTEAEPTPVEVIEPAPVEAIEPAEVEAIARSAPRLRRTERPRPTLPAGPRTGAAPETGAIEAGAVDPTPTDVLASYERVERAEPLEPGPPRAEAPLPPARAEDAPTRIRLDEDLTIEVDVQEASVDVTLEGDDDAIEPLADLGRELERALDEDGFDLGSFAHREHPGDRRAELYRPRRVPRNAASNQEEPESVASARVRLDGSGRHVDILV